MSDNLFKIIMALIPIIGAIITSFIIPYLKTKVSSAQFDEISKWVSKAVEAAEVLFNLPGCGDEKREYVIDFINKAFNAKKQVITEDQIRILLEAAWKEMNDAE